MLKITVDGTEVEVQHGATVMDAAHKIGAYVPHFCWHKKLSIAANCRMCLVEVEKAPKPLPACATPVTDGMKVWTHSPAAKTAQNGVMEFLLINHPLDCPICDQGGECQLQDLAVGYGHSSSRYQEEKRVVLRKELGPLVADLDALYVNFISGFELDLPTAQLLRRGFPGAMYADFHSLFLGKLPDGTRVLQPLADPAAWFACFDVVQLNDEELAQVVEQANRVINQIAEQEKFDLILQDAVYRSPRIDITDRVIKALESKPPAK